MNNDNRNVCLKNKIKTANISALMLGTMVPFTWLNCLLFVHIPITYRYIVK